MRRTKTSRRLALELIVYLAVFAAGTAWAVAGAPIPWLPATWTTLVLAGAFWWGVQIAPGGGVLQTIVLLAGVTLLAASLLEYATAGLLLPFPVLAAVTGAALAVNFVLNSQSPGAGGTILLGYSSLGREICQALGSRIRGVVAATEPALPSGVAYLGGYGDLEAAIASGGPADIVIDEPGEESRLRARLVAATPHTASVESAAIVYQNVFRRVSLAHLRFGDLFWTDTGKNRQIMAIQAVYSNLTGLALLVLLSPFLLVLGTLARVNAGPGPFFESIPCAGFQGIPFRRREFRTRRAGTGALTATGRFLRHFRLTKLPLVVNLVRGEMALFGPEPVRTEFAARLDRYSPVFTSRLSVRPGILGWAQTHSRTDDFLEPLRMAEEHQRLAYDLYYLEHGSLFMDLEITGATLTAGFRR